MALLSCRSVMSVGRRGASLPRVAGGAAGRGDRDGEADADEVRLLRRVHEAADDADDVPVAVEQRAAAAAGVDGGVELDEPGHAVPLVDPDRAVERRDDA